MHGLHCKLAYEVRKHILLFVYIGDYRIESRPIPKVGVEEVLVKVLSVGICAGDAKCFAGAPYFWGMLTLKITKTNNSSYVSTGDKDKGHPRYVEPPVIPGHEFVGEVIELGPGTHCSDKN